MFGGIVNDNIYLVILKPNVMKLKILILIAGVVVLASCGPSYRVTDQSTVSKDTIGVPSEIKSAFSTQYPTATNVVWTTYDASATPLVDWDLNGWPAPGEGAYVATFNLNSDTYYAWYGANNDWIGTAYAVNDYNSLPPAINTMLNDKFAGYTISSANREMKKGQMAYELQLKNGDSKIKMLVDDNGNIIKQKTMEK
jgi:hypothetical protein